MLFEKIFETLFSSCIQLFFSFLSFCSLRLL